jgi:hypothetical protein
MLVNSDFRKEVVSFVKDPLVKRFWVEEFAGYSDRYSQEATPAIQNKIGQFTSNPLVRNIIGQNKSSFNLRQMMDERKIIIVNLSKGRIGEQNADLLGSMLTTKIYLEAMSRADVGNDNLNKLSPFYLYVDEFQTVVNDSFTNILSEARKYRLALTIAHQYIEQVDDNIRAAVFGNVGSTVSFRVGPLDAEVLETIFSPTFKVEDIVSLGFAQIYLTLMIDGISSAPFSANTLPPVEEPPYDFSKEIIDKSREQYASLREQVESQIKEVDLRRGSAKPDKDRKDKSKGKEANKDSQDEKTKDKKNEKKIKSPADILREKLKRETPLSSVETKEVATQSSASKKQNTGSLRELIDMIVKNQDVENKEKREENPMEEIKADKSAHKSFLKKTFEKIERVAQSKEKGKNDKDLKVGKEQSSTPVAGKFKEAKAKPEDLSVNNDTLTGALKEEEKFKKREEQDSLRDVLQDILYDQEDRTDN